MATYFFPFQKKWIRKTVTLAEAGVQDIIIKKIWIPASSGMTHFG
jgi:hypothetical protein